MQRQWRNKPSKDLIKIFEESVDIRLYLVQEKGPLSFVLQEESKKKFSITIGSDIICSCGGGRSEHCIHTIYTLNRFFKIQFTDPLILQLHYTDSELAKIIELRRKSNNITKSHNFSEKNKNKTESKSSFSNRMDLFEDQTCPICQEDMYIHEGLFFCLESCGHNFHSKCIKIWGEHKRSTSDTISCPMCRAVWNEDELKKNALKLFETQKIHKGVNCANCERKNIKMERFHCLNCPNLDLCVECYALRKHNQSHHFIMKKSESQKWVGIVNNKLGDCDPFVLFANSELSYVVRNNNLSQFLISILEDFDKNEKNDKNENLLNSHNSHISQNSDSVLVNSTFKCIVCNSDRLSSLQLLKLKSLPNCNHLTHFKCAENLFKFPSENENKKEENYDTTKKRNVNYSFNTCCIDNKEIFPGLTSIILNKTISVNSHNGKELNSIANKKQKDKLNPIKINKEMKSFENILTINSFPIIKRNLIGSNNTITNTNRVLINSKPKSVTPLGIRRGNFGVNTDFDGLCLNIKKMDFNQEENKTFNTNKQITQNTHRQNITKVIKNVPRVKSKVEKIVIDELPINENNIQTQPEMKIDHLAKHDKGLRVINMNTMHLKVIKYFLF